jgi:complement component 1 Q subcomponent-binding protein
MKFGFSSLLCFFSFHLFPPPSSVYLSVMSVLRSLRQLSVASSRALALRSAPAARLRLPTLATRASVSATRAFSVSARSLAEGSCQCHLPLYEHTNAILIFFFLAWQCTTADVLLAQKLKEELQYEKTATAEVIEPEFLKSFKNRVFGRLRIMLMWMK